MVKDNTTGKQKFVHKDTVKYILDAEEAYQEALLEEAKARGFGEVIQARFQKWMD